VQVSIDHLICSDMAPSTAATEFRATLDALNIAQHRVAKLFGVGPRSVRRWVHGDRSVPRGVDILVRLLRAGVVTVDQVEQAAAPVRASDSAKPRPPTPRLVEPEPEPEQSAVARAEAAAFVGLSPAAAAVVALDAKSCRWPEGDPGRSGFRFCNDPVTAPPYCARHRAQAYLAPRTGSGHGVRVAYGRRLSISGVFSATDVSRPLISRATLPVAHSRPLDREASPC
jgi:transcriptional regulator with XRE-family HTH domain